jgi:hypothetical protein
VVFHTEDPYSHRFFQAVLSLSTLRRYITLAINQLSSILRGCTYQIH